MTFFVFRNGGWWNVDSYTHIVGPVALQFANGAYIKALDNGKFVLGAPHGDGEVISFQSNLIQLIMIIIYGHAQSKYKSKRLKQKENGKYNFTLYIKICRQVTSNRSN